MARDLDEHLAAAILVQRDHESPAVCELIQERLWGDIGGGSHVNEMERGFRRQSVHSIAAMHRHDAIVDQVAVSHLDVLFRELSQPRNDLNAKHPPGFRFDQASKARRQVAGPRTDIEDARMRHVLDGGVSELQRMRMLHENDECREYHEPE